MNLLVLDFETFFDQDYSLSKMTTEAYVRDPRFKAHMLGYWLPAKMPAPANLSPALLQQDDVRRLIEESAVLCHHAHFDGLILSHHYGLRPKMWLDTLSMSRLILPKLKSHSLDALALHFGLPSKHVPYHLFKGVPDLWGELYAQVAAGCEWDCHLTYEIFRRLLPAVPREELTVIDATIRCFTEPVLELDRPRMEKFLLEERVRKAKAMLAAGRVILKSEPYPTADGIREYLAAVETELQSSDKFKLALEALGHACPMKWSPKQEKEIPALAKNDPGMEELLEHPDSRVQALAAARLGVKSTIDETRAERLLDSAGRGALPVYLSYAAAKTLRFGGGDKTNWQNFRRGGEIRKSVVAPPGSKLVIGDLSQIEYRLLLWLTGQHDKLEALAAGRDLYCEFASQFYGEIVTKEMKEKRGVGKQGVLMCLAGGALTITSNGVKPIELVTEQDLLWDGVEWVAHQGLVETGEKDVIDLAGLRLTPDHPVLCGDQWCLAATLRDEKYLFQALVSGSENLPLRRTESGLEEGLRPYWYAALAERFRTRSTFTTSPVGARRAAIGVLKQRALRLLKNIGAMLRSSLIASIDTDCFVEFPPALSAATTLNARRINGTEPEDCKCFGAATSTPFCATSLRCQDGTILSWSSTEKTIRAAMSLAIYGLYQERSISRIVARLRASNKFSQPCSKRTTTYDLACAGPRNRFTVVSSAGPLIVHNSGYGAGADTQIRTAAGGGYGPPVYLTAMEGQRIVDLYRQGHPCVTAFWRWCDRVLPILGNGGQADYKGVIQIKDHRIWFPNGTAMNYEGMRHATNDQIFEDQEPDGDVPSWWEPTRKGWSRMWGSKLTADIIQGLARVVIARALTRVVQKYRLALQVHDELVLVVPDAQAGPVTPKPVTIEETVEGTAVHFLLGELLQAAESFAPDLQLEAEGLCMQNYEK